MPRSSLQIRLPSQERAELRSLLAGGIQPVRSVLRAVALLQISKGVSAPRISEMIPLTAQAIRKVGHRFERGGLDRVLYDKQRPGAASLPDDSQKQRIIAMVCGDPPSGRSRWTVRLVAQEAVSRSLVPRVGREAIRVLLLDHDLKPWRETMWCVPELNEHYIHNMEDVLSVYERPYDPAQAVVCPDEKPVTLHADLRPASPSKPGREARQDSEYERCGTANIFLAVKPKAGRHFTFPTPDRSASQFAKCVMELALAYRKAQTVHLVMDNLNIHRRKSFTDAFGAESAATSGAVSRSVTRPNTVAGTILSKSESAASRDNAWAREESRILRPFEKNAALGIGLSLEPKPRLTGISTANPPARPSTTKRSLLNGQRTRRPWAVLQAGIASKFSRTILLNRARSTP